MLVGDFRDDRRIETVLLQGKTRLTRQLDRAREVPRQLVDGTGDDRSARPVVVDPDDQLPAGMPTFEAGQHVRGRRYRTTRYFQRVYPDLDPKLGRASCRERVGQYVSLSVVPGSLQKKNTTQ